VRGDITAVSIEPGVIKDDVEVFIPKSSTAWVKEVLRNFRRFIHSGDAIV